MLLLHCIIIMMPGVEGISSPVFTSSKGFMDTDIGQVAPQNSRNCR